MGPGHNKVSLKDSFLTAAEYPLSSTSNLALVTNSSKEIFPCLRHLNWYLESTWLLCGFV